MKTPREFLKDSGFIDLTFDNESHDCDLSWSMIENILSIYAQEFAREKTKEEIEGYKSQINGLRIMMKENVIEAVKLAREIEYGELYEHSPVTYTEQEILEKLKL